jgi:hypothetical protein
MNMNRFKILYLFLSGLVLGVNVANAGESSEFADKVINEHQIKGDFAVRLKNLLTKSVGLTRNIGTEDENQIKGPRNSWHPTSRAQCRKNVLDTKIIQQNPEFEKICGAKWMAPVLENEADDISKAKVCIDQFEFPNIPCEYPVVWTPARTAKQICENMGKRVCNSHEWEGACAGSMDVQDPYLFSLGSLQARRAKYNKDREIVFAFQWAPEHINLTNTQELCGVYSENDPDLMAPMRENPSAYYSSIGKSKQCAPDYNTCGSNTWPSGFKYRCRTQLGVYDMHGNIAEVTSFPANKNEIARENITGHTERKGSFFVRRKGSGMNYPDDCRVRQPYEHFGAYASDGMSFYQEGFRCCKEAGK